MTNLYERADNIAASIRQLIDDALKEGEERAISRVLSAVRPTEKVTQVADNDHDIDDTREGKPSEQDRKRAPKGTVGRLVDRALAAASPNGLRTQDILDAAEDEFERMVKAASIRGRLRNGVGEGKYREDNGVWFLDQDSKSDARSTSTIARRPSDDLLNGTSTSVQVRSKAKPDFARLLAEAKERSHQKGADDALTP